MALAVESPPAFVVSSIDGGGLFLTRQSLELSHGQQTKDNASSQHFSL